MYLSSKVSGCPLHGKKTPTHEVRLTVVLGESRNDHLGVALGAQCAALQQRLAKIDAAGVHVQSGVHVVQRIDDHIQI